MSVSNEASGVSYGFAISAAAAKSAPVADAGSGSSGGSQPPRNAHAIIHSPLFNLIESLRYGKVGSTN